MKKIIAYKGFDKDLKCRDFQYEVGKTYEHKGEVIPCQSGFHACEHPFDVFGFYVPAESRFAEVELSGDMEHRTDKICASSITLKAEIKLNDYIKVGFDFIWNAADKKKSNHVKGDQSASSATGYRSASSATGYQSASSATGDQSASLTTGNYASSAADSEDNKNAVAVGVGYENKAKATQGDWIVLAEHNDNSEITAIKTAQAGVTRGIKPDTYYKLENKKFVEAD